MLLVHLYFQILESKILQNTYFWWVFLFGAIGGVNKNRQNMKPRKNIIEFSYTIRNKWTNLHSMLVFVSIKIF